MSSIYQLHYSNGTPLADVTLRWTSSTNTWADESLTQNPVYLTKTNSAATTTSVSSVVAGNTIYGWKSNSGLRSRFVHPSSGLDTVGNQITELEHTLWGISPNSYWKCISTTVTTGPTVTSITRNESNNLITVLHTGTLTSSDVNHTISNVSSSISNLQTITNGSTFTTSGANGAHVIQIGNEILTYFIHNTTSGRTTMSSTNNIVVSFPTTDNDWLSNFSAYNSGTIANVVYTTTKTHVNFAKNSARNYYVFVTFNLSYNSNQGFSVLTQIYDYETSSAANNWAYSYNSTLQWVDPEATFESTGSADTLITLPTNDIVTSFNWNFASVVASETTTSNGGGKPDRYPLIMTNLFNRNRSIYSIGMTHKDTWDLFL